MKYDKIIICVAAVLLTLTFGTAAAQELTPKEQLGMNLFFDEDLSTPPGQSCAACHDPAWGFTGPDSEINNAGAVYPGAVHTRFGNRKPPTAAYGGDSPVLNEVNGVFVGGMFWDGRATGWTLGDPLAEQAQGPFLNPLEQNNPDAKQVCIKVQDSDYAGLFEEVWGPGSLDCINDVAGTYERIARSIAAYERSGEVNPSSSKYDAYLMHSAKLSKLEARGLKLFEGKAMCSACHIPPLFTDFTYDNLGVPRNPQNPFYSMPPSWNPDGIDWVDKGLGGFLATISNPYADANMGKQKVPTLRNVDKKPPGKAVKAYGHNGYFKSLKGIVHFYNTRDVKPVCPDPFTTEKDAMKMDCWPAPEVPENVNTNELGNLGLTEAEENAIVAFMMTLSDGYVP